MTLHHKIFVILKKKEVNVKSRCGAKVLRKSTEKNCKAQSTKPRKIFLLRDKPWLDKLHKEQKEI